MKAAVALSWDEQKVEEEAEEEVGKAMETNKATVIASGLRPRQRKTLGRLEQMRRRAITGPPLLSILSFIFLLFLNTHVS